MDINMTTNVGSSMTTHVGIYMTTNVAVVRLRMSHLYGYDCRRSMTTDVAVIYIFFCVGRIEVPPTFPTAGRHPARAAKPPALDRYTLVTTAVQAGEGTRRSPCHLIHKGGPF